MTEPWDDDYPVQYSLVKSYEPHFYPVRRRFRLFWKRFACPVFSGRDRKKVNPDLSLSAKKLWLFPALYRSLSHVMAEARRQEGLQAVSEVSDVICDGGCS